MLELTDTINALHNLKFHLRLNIPTVGYLTIPIKAETLYRYGAVFDFNVEVNTYLVNNVEYLYGYPCITGFKINNVSDLENDLQTLVDLNLNKEGKERLLDYFTSSAIYAVSELPLEKLTLFTLDVMNEEAKPEGILFQNKFQIKFEQSTHPTFTIPHLISTDSYTR